jgi:hypothetical protein
LHKSSLSFDHSNRLTRTTSAQIELGNSFVTCSVERFGLTGGGPADKLSPNPARTLSPKLDLTEKGESNHEH